MHEREIFTAALAIPGAAERRGYLATACAGDEALRRRVEVLLQAHERARLFLERPPFAAADAGERIGPPDRDDRWATRPTEELLPSGERAGDEDDEADPLDFLEPSAEPGSLGRLAHYEVHEVLGRGGFGTVVRAFDEKLHRMVAIKVMARGLAATSPPRKRFLREARAAAAVRHEHVVSIHAVDEQPIPYLVMEYVAGPTLQQKLDRSGPIEVAEVLRIGHQIAEGLAAAHRQGLIHRDIKPANILLEDAAERVKITDFGLARAADDASLTQSGTIAGTPLYMAPEQALGEAVDQRADLFSLGSVLYVMCTGRPPFRAPSTLAVLRRVAEDTPRPIREVIPEVPAALCDLIARLHAKDPADRPASAEEVAAQLKGLFEARQSPRGAHPAVTPPRPGARHQPIPLDSEFLPTHRHGAKGKGDQIRLADISLGTMLTWSFLAVLILAGLIAAAQHFGPNPEVVATPAPPPTPVPPPIPTPPLAPGTLEISTDDLNVEILVTGDGPSVVSPGGTWNHLFTLRPGKYRYTARRQGQVVGGGETFITTNTPQRVQMFVGAAPGQPGTDLGPWGRFLDPKGGSQAKRDGDRGTISMPADTPRDLNPTVNDSNAPRVVTDIVGDFKFEVTVPPFPVPDATASVDGGGNVYHWFGPIVWADERNFFRFGVGRSTIVNDGAPDDVFECFRGGRAITLEGSAAHAATTHFQVERRGDALFVRRSADGQRWSAFRTCSLVGMPARLQVGVAAVNTGNDAFAPSFVDWSLHPLVSGAPDPRGGPIPPGAPDLGPWGRLVTPIADCRAIRDGGRLTIEMPADAPCDLNPGPDKDLAAPRLLQAVDGDFTIRAQVAQFPRPRRDPSAAPREQTYYFAGLLIWADERNFLRFGINSNTDFEGGAPCLDLEFFRNLKDITGDVRRTDEGPGYLQAERRGNTLSLKTSTDGLNWSSYRTCSLAGLPAQIHVGVVAINTGVGSFAPEFEDWSLRSAGSRSAGGEGGQAPPAMTSDLGPWGRLVDPDGGSQVTRRGDRLTLMAPGARPRDLSPVPGYNLDAPRVLRRVSGDFTAKVTVLPFPRAGREASDSGKPNAYHGAGLVVWVDGRNLLRFDRASLFGSGDGAPHLHLELFRDARTVETELHWTPEAPTHLQVERRGDTLIARTSADGRTWADYKACTLPGMPGEIQVGVVAINTSTKDFSPRFEGWSLQPVDANRP